MRQIKITYKKLGRNKAWGIADSDSGVELDTRLKGKKHLEIIVHESMHLLFPKLSEEQVIKKSILLTNALWKDGYRKVDNSNDIKLQDGTL